MNSQKRGNLQSSMSLPHYTVSQQELERIFENNISSLWGSSSVKKSSLKASSFDCKHGDIFATWNSSLKDSSSIEEDDEFEEHDEDLRF